MERIATIVDSLEILKEKKKMATQFRVEKVNRTSPWESNYGPMISWKMTCVDLSTGRSGSVEVNAKPGYAYSEGDVFWAEHNGDYQGSARLKRVQAPSGAENAPAGLPAPKSGIPVAPTRISYERACVVYCQMTLEHPEVAAILFKAWLDGKIEDPK